MNTSSNRRDFIAKTATALSAIALSPSLNYASKSQPMNSKPLCSNQYPWDTFYRRAGLTFNEELDANTQKVVESGADSIEPNLESVEMVSQYASALSKNGLKMKSIYVNSVLHEANRAEASIEQVLKIAREAQRLCNSEIVVTNPSPISWGGPENKTDAQIATQGKALNKLGAALRAEGLTLAYHNHDSELRLAARELHHSLVSTDPDNVKFCLDSHWVYRGSENSTIALFDVVELYADRIVELHVRQSKNGIWTETYSAKGDVDYLRLIRTLQKKGINPLVVSEQAVEPGSAETMNALDAHKITHANMRKDFAAFL